MQDAVCAESKEKSCIRFSDYIFFLSNGHFFIQNWQFSMNFHDNSKNENRNNRKIDFSFVSAHSASFMKMGARLRGGGVCISLVGTRSTVHSM